MDEILISSLISVVLTGGLVGVLLKYKIDQGRLGSLNALDDANAEKTQAEALKVTTGTLMDTILQLTERVSKLEAERNVWQELAHLRLIYLTQMGHGTEVLIDPSLEVGRLRELVVDDAAPHRRRYET